MRHRVPVSASVPRSAGRPASLWLAPLLLVAACGACGDKTPPAAAPSYAPVGVDWSAMYGSPPATPLPLPAFSATAQDGSTRTAEDLRGRPTVLWFYPAADTPG